MTPEQMTAIEERIYIVRYTEKFYYTEATNKEEVFSWKDRQEAILRYLELGKDANYSNIRFQIAQPMDIDMEEFLKNF